MHSLVKLITMFILDEQCCLDTFVLDLVYHSLVCVHFLKHVQHTNKYSFKYALINTFSSTTFSTVSHMLHVLRYG